MGEKNPHVAAPPTPSMKRLLKRRPHPFVLFLTIACCFYASFTAFFLLRQGSLHLPHSLTPQPPSLPSPPSPPSPLAPPPHSFLKKACRAAEDPADCFSTISAVPSTAEAADGEEVLAAVLRHVAGTLEESKSELASRYSNLTTDGRRRKEENRAAAEVQREVLSECSSFLETGLHFLRVTDPHPDPAEPLRLASFYVFTCIRVVGEIEEGHNGPSMEPYMRSLLDHIDHLCQVGSDFWYKNAFGVMDPVRAATAGRN